MNLLANRYMYTNFLLLCIVVSIVALTGCLPKLPTYPKYRTSISYYAQKMIANKEIMTVYSNQRVGVGDSLRLMPARVGDSVQSIASTIYDQSWYYLIVKGNDSLWVRYGDVVSTDAYLATTQYRIFAYGPIRVHNSIAEQVWSRVLVWISKNSDMRIQLSNDQIIDTYNPLTDGKNGFTATKLIEQDSVAIEIECKTYGTLALLDRKCRPKVLAAKYYALSGKETNWFMFDY